MEPFPAIPVVGKKQEEGESSSSSSMIIPKPVRMEKARPAHQPGAAWPLYLYRFHSRDDDDDDDGPCRPGTTEGQMME